MKSRYLYLLAVSLLALQSCRLFNPSQMLRTGINYPYTKFAQADSLPQLYMIAIDDIISFTIATNNGEKIIDPTGMGGGGQSRSYMQNQSGGNQAGYQVEYDGTVKLPVLGRIKLQGYTLRDAENYLEELYSKYYNDPFVRLNVNNNRIFIFPGSRTGRAQVLSLSNNNTTLLEALAMSGGINDGKAYRIKIIRGNLSNPEVYLVDLSTIDGMKDANLVLQAGDIIYIESRNMIPERVVGTITPYMAMLSTLLIVLSYTNTK